MKLLLSLDGNRPTEEGAAELAEKGYEVNKVFPVCHNIIVTTSSQDLREAVKEVQSVIGFCPMKD